MFHRLRRLYCPTMWIARVEHLPVAALQSLNIKGVIADVDNTLVDYHKTDIRDEVKAWIQRLKESDITICLLSNTIRGDRLKIIAEELDVPYVACGVIPYKGPFTHKALGAKPHRSAFHRALALLGLKPEEVAMVGDQVFTDIRGALRCSCKLVVLVTPSSTTEHWGTRIKRVPETRLLRLFARKGWLKLDEQENNQEG